MINRSLPLLPCSLAFPDHYFHGGALRVLVDEHDDSRRTSDDWISSMGFAFGNSAHSCVTHTR